jgi:hypothetical protein
MTTQNSKRRKIGGSVLVPRSACIWSDRIYASLRTELSGERSCGSLLLYRSGPGETGTRLETGYKTEHKQGAE